MSDYLGNILGRISPQASVIKPRIPSLFEATAAKTVIDSPAEADTSVESAAPAFAPLLSATKRSKSEAEERRPLQLSDQTGPEPIAESAREIRIQPRVKATIKPEEPNPVSPAADAVQVPPTLPRTALPRSQPIAPAESRPPVATAPANFPVTDRPPPQSKPIFAAPEPVNFPADRARGQPTVVRDRETIPNQITQHSNAISRVVSDETKFAPAHRPPSATTAVSNGITVRPVTPLREPNHSSSVMPGRRESWQLAAQTVSVAQPSIHVTIGRVEVRATTSTPPSRARAKKEPEMSLESYLQRRTDGGRR